MQEITAVQKLIDTVIEYSVNYGFQVLGALIILLLGFGVANWVGNLLSKAFAKKKMDVTLSGFLTTCVRMIILAFAFIIALGKFGITIAPFIAALSAMAFGASFAIQGPLSNYGAGISIILSRPFVVGNTITVSGETGIVQEVKLACTVLKNADGVEITIPNKSVVGQILHNSKEYKVVTASIGISYDSSPDSAIELIHQVLKKFPNVVHQPAPQVGIESFGDSAVNIAYRFWAPTVEYFQTLYEVNKSIFNAFNQAGIKIPYPQRDIRIISQPAVSNR